VVVRRKEPGQNCLNNGDLLHKIADLASECFLDFLGFWGCC